MLKNRKYNNPKILKSVVQEKSVYICGRIFVLFELLLFPSASDLWFVFVNKNLCPSVLSVGKLRVQGKRLQ